MRFGKRHFPTYRIVALDKRQKRDGAYIESLGTYNPMMEPAELKLNEERFNYWKGVGAIISEGVRKIMVSREPKKAAPAKEAPKAEAKAEKAKPAKATKKKSK
jgi:small subunit ribosomal protein S16